MAPLNPDAKRLRNIIISFPILVVTTAILYRRTYLGEQQRTLPRAEELSVHGQEQVLGRSWVTPGGTGANSGPAVVGNVRPS